VLRSRFVILNQVPNLLPTESLQMMPALGIILNNSVTLY
jgi:hypothetical protein